ncbi:MAG TPA: hypothetical protein DEF34_02300 [Desulfotomaculum sp.]|nr:MAG: hypothetical protein JL56_03395 [Desulfotomaculum sp. BICA1-6]HBX22457.1 hypothetical protein [Desulfotomaculum sp.]
MAIIHITQREKWVQIQELGYLVPAKKICSGAMGGDPEKVSAFYGIDRDDHEALRELRNELVRAKNQTRQKPLSGNDFVILEITCSDIEWEYFSSQKKEMIAPFGQLPLEVYERLGGYCKTYQTIPVSCLQEVCLP